MENGTNPGSPLHCPPGYFVNVNFESPKFTCTRDAGVCPGSFHFGCEGSNVPELNCINALNPFGECGCEGQFFISDDCLSGFYCTNDINDPLIFDGCYRECEEGQILLPDFANNEWSCVSEDTTRCRGQFNINCPEDDIGHDFDSSICECNGQMWVDHDCRTGFYCWDRLANGGSNIQCSEGQVIQSDFESFQFRCVEDVGQCPGLGGFKYGCSAGAIDPPQIECEYGPNPFVAVGCECEGQIFIGNQCTEAFYCSQYVEPGPNNEGCHLECPTGERVHLDLVNMEWSCINKTTGYICPGDLSVDCPENKNPPVQCECKNQIWVSNDCTTGFWCTDVIGDDGINPGQQLTCPEGMHLDIDFENPSYRCTSDPGRCPGSFKFGCVDASYPDYNCESGNGELALNNLGECGCEGQFFISEDCKEGFLCTKFIDDPFLFDGCKATCDEGFILLPDFAGDKWDCVPDTAYKCPGKFNLNCYDDNVGSGFDSSICDCDGQLWINDDCTEGFYCWTRLGGGGASINCPDGQTVDADFENFQFACKPDNGLCPGLGGFQLGCELGAVEPPAIECTYSKNSLGMCDDCEGQIFIGNDCRSAFYCSKYIEGVDNEGCLKECSENQRVHVDLMEMTWDCVEREETFICTGDMKVDCTPDLTVECGCANEIWVGPDCQSGFWCTDVQDPNTGINRGRALNCPDGEHLDVDFVTGDFGCTTEEGRCPGSFHFGCNGGNIPDLTTSDPNVPTTTTTTDPNEPTTTTTTDPNTPTTTTDPNEPTTTSTTDPNAPTTTTDPNAPSTTTSATTPPGSGNGSNSRAEICIFLLFVCMAALI